MKVIWVYENIKGDNSFYTKLDTLLLISSGVQWKKHHPQYSTSLYCDKLTKTFLEDLNALDTWNQVIILSTNKSIDKSVFWASSKLEVLRNIKEPVLIMDHDFLVYRNISNLFSDKHLFAHEEDGVRYYPTANDPFIQQVSDLLPRPKPYAVNCCFSFFPDYRFANKYAEFSLELMYRFTKLKVPNSKFLIFAEQLALKHLLDYHKVEYDTLMKEVFLANERKFVSCDKGLIPKEETYKYFKHYWMDKPRIRKDENCIEYINLKKIVGNNKGIKLEKLNDLRP